MITLCKINFFFFFHKKPKYQEKEAGTNLILLTGLYMIGQLIRMDQSTFYNLSHPREFKNL